MISLLKHTTPHKGVEADKGWGIMSFFIRLAQLRAAPAVHNAKRYTLECQDNFIKSVLQIRKGKVSQMRFELIT